MAKASTKAPAKRDDKTTDDLSSRIQPMDIEFFQQTMRERKEQIVALLAGTTTYERFEMVAMMALQQNRDLLLCHPMSLFAAFREAAKMQLMPDGKDGVITPYDTQQGRLAKFNPMYPGLLRKALNDPAIRKIETNIVGENDEFEWVEGTAPEVKLKRNLKSGSGELVASYCLITLNNGEIMLEILDRPTAHEIKALSAKKSPWHGAFEGEMWRKAVLRRALKWAPISQATKDALGNEDDVGMIDVSPTREMHPDNALTHAEPPNPQLTHQMSTQVDMGSGKEGALVEQSGGEQGATGQQMLQNPDTVLREFKDELALADTEDDLNATVQAWRDKLSDMFPPDVDAANKMVDERRSALRRKK